MLDVMRRRAPLAALLMGVAVAGFLAIGLVQAAGSGPDLGEPVVVSQTPVGSAQSREGRTSEPTSTEPTSARPSSPKRTATEPAPTERPAITPSERTAKVEPVRPPSPRPGGDDDDDDDGGDDDD
jgi:septal ring-binding cell division protein DamX